MTFDPRKKLKINLNIHNVKNENAVRYYAMSFFFVNIIEFIDFLSKPYGF